MKKVNPAVAVCLAFALSSIGCAGSTSKMNNGGQNGGSVALNGDYAFTFSGITGGPGYSEPFAAVGRFTADGAGNLTNGEVDTNGIGTGAVLTAQSFKGTYTIGADHRGVMTLDIPGHSKLAFAMMPDGNAQFIGMDIAGGSGTIGSGTIEKVDASAFNAARITGDYAFGFSGLDANNNREALVGRFTSNGAGTFTNGAADANASTGSNTATMNAAAYTVSDKSSGRGSMNLSLVAGGTPRNLNFAFYVVNAGKLFAMVSDSVAGSTPLLNGAVLRQQTPSGGFSNASMKDGTVIYLTGLSVCGTASGSSPNVFVGLLNSDGNGAVNLTFDQNCGGSATSAVNQVGTYNVASNGRASILAGGAPAVAYLVSPNTAFFMGSDSSVLFGLGEPQVVTSFTNSQVKGAYAGLASSPATFGVTTFSGEFSADGSSPTGNMTGVEDTVASNGPKSGVTFKSTYSLSSSGANGRGTMKVASGPGGNAIVYLVSPSKFVAVSLDDPNPAIMIFAQAMTSPN